MNQAIRSKTRIIAILFFSLSFIITYAYALNFIAKIVISIGNW